MGPSCSGLKPLVLKFLFTFTAPSIAQLSEEWKLNCLDMDTAGPDCW